jgi:SulP family sulfate permease
MPHRSTARYAARGDAPWSSLFAPALRASLRGYRRSDLTRDALAGAVVGVVALPLSMALAIAVGAPPQAGLYTAIVGGFLAATFGGSRMQVTGPTAAFIVILAPIVDEFGMAGLLTAGLLAGLMLIAFGLLRLGRLIQFVPHPVTTGFSAGIAVVIALMQLKDLFGLDVSGGGGHGLGHALNTMWEARSTARWQEAAVGLSTLALLVGLPRITRRVPAPVVVLPVIAAIAWATSTFVDAFTVETIGTRFTWSLGNMVGHGIPSVPPAPALPWVLPGAGDEPFTLSVPVLRALLPAAFAIAMLGAIESLLSAVIADGMSRTRHDPDAELVGQGIANVVTPFFGGIPATGALARTATNVRFGARSPVAAMVHAAVVLLAVLALAPLVAFLPMAALAGLLLLVAWNMSEARHFIHTLRVAPRGDVFVLVACFALTILFDMVVAVTFGVVLSALIFMRRMAEVTSGGVTSGSEEDMDEAGAEGVLVYRISGPLFFGAAQKAMASLQHIDDVPARGVVLRMEDVPSIDATGLVALESALHELAERGVVVALSGLGPAPLRLVTDAGLLDGVHVAAFADRQDAMAFAAGTSRAGEATGN